MNKAHSKDKNSIKRDAGQVEIIPAINADSFEEIQRKIEAVEEANSDASVGVNTDASVGVNWIQIDAADGTFTKNTIWHNPEDLAFLKTDLKIELHLMLDNIERRIEDWLVPNARRIIFHISAANDLDFIIEKCREAGKEVGIAIGPDESLVRAMEYRDKVDMFQILSVYPGKAGAEMAEGAFERISELRGFCEHCIIEVDGGMNKETAKKAVEAGADIIAAASAIFSAKDVKNAIKELKSEIQKP